MPELPEVEVTRLGISGALIGTLVAGITIRDLRLAALVPADIGERLIDERIRSIDRRGKYLLFSLGSGTLLVHLGMTGHLRLVPAQRPPGKHDLFDLTVHTGTTLRLNDTRHFGSIHWTEQDPKVHRLIAHLGPEPLTEAFCGDYLHRRSQGKTVAVQRFIMDAAIVAGVGNIYAAESLFRCGLLPTTPTGSLSGQTCERLVQAIREVLAASIVAGRSGMDFNSDQGRLAYYPLELMVYGRENQPCRSCQNPVQRGRLGNRSTYFCIRCQR